MIKKIVDLFNSILFFVYKKKLENVDIFNIKDKVVIKKAMFYYDRSNISAQLAAEVSGCSYSTLNLYMNGKLNFDDVRDSTVDSIVSFYYKVKQMYEADRNYYAPYIKQMVKDGRINDISYKLGVSKNFIIDFINNKPILSTRADAIRRMVILDKN